MQKLYLSCPITDNPNHREEFAAVHRVLAGIGYLVVNPLEVSACANETCAGSSFSETDGDGIWRESFRHSWSCYIKYDLEALLHCDGIVLLPRWEKSPGCRLEFMVASSIGLEIYYWDERERDFCGHGS